MDLHNTLSKKTVAIISYVSTPIPIENLEEFLKLHAPEVIVVGHAFFFNVQEGSFVRKWRHGTLTQSLSAHMTSRSELAYYLKTCWYTFRTLLRMPDTDICIGLGNLPALLGIMLRFFGKTKQVVYYAIDFVPKRFPKPWLNTFYHSIDNFVIVHVDRIWNLSPRMIEMRERKGIPVAMRAKQTTVPIGTNPGALRLPFNEIDSHAVVYVGHLRPLQGLELLLDAWPKVLASVPDARLILIGHGPLETLLREKAMHRGISYAVEFKGFIKDQADVEQILARCGLAVAPYMDSDDAFVRYTDPGKIKTYVSSDLPVVITDVPAVARELERAGCGVIVPYDPEAYAHTIARLLSDPIRLKEYRARALQFAEQYRWDLIWTRAFETMPS